VSGTRSRNCDRTSCPGHAAGSARAVPALPAPATGCEPAG
jgi:hypothetical protein